MMRERRNSKRIWWWGAGGLVAVIIATILIFMLIPKHLQVAVYSVKRQTLQDKVFESGTVKSTERQIVMPSSLSAPIAHFDVQVGDKVQTGKTLIELQNAPQRAALNSQQQVLTSAQQAVQQAQNALQSAPSLLVPQLAAAVTNAKQGLAEAILQERQAQAAFDATLIRANFTGSVVIEHPNGIASDGSPAPVIEIVGQGRQVVCYVSEVDAIHIQKNMQAKLTSDAFPSRKWAATVIRVADYASQDSSGNGQVEVILRVPNDFPVPLGYQVDVNIISETHKEVPVVPYSAIIPDGSAYAVYTVQAGKVQKVDVTLGITTDTQVEVVKGIAPGQVVVLNPPATLVDNAQVSIQ